MNNEPVAWIVDGVITYSNDIAQGISEESGKPIIPLYTHPAKELGNPVAWRSQDPDGYWSVYQSPVEGAEPLYTGFKELTDEEIKDFIATFPIIFTPDDLVIFARAILRKAQENEQNTGKD